MHKQGNGRRREKVKVQTNKPKELNNDEITCYQVTKTKCSNTFNDKEMNISTLNFLYLVFDNLNFHESYIML